VTGKQVMKLVEIGNPTRDLTSVCRSAKAGSEDSKLVVNFTNLLDQCTVLDPSRRISVADAMKHSFFVTK
jgi:serine/threonine protein kinase